VAAATLTVSGTMGLVVDASSAIFGFNEYGILLNGGHGAMISETWLAAYAWDSVNKTATASVAIRLIGNDCYLDTLVCYSARVALQLEGAANTVSRVHAWNDASANGGVGVLVRKGQNRILDSYFDYTALQLEGAGAHRAVVTGGFFIHSQIVFNATTPADDVQGTTIAGCIWTESSAPPLAVIELGGCAFTAVVDMTVSGLGLAPGQPYLGPTAELALAPAAPRPAAWAADFSSRLLFPAVPIAATTWVLSGDVADGAAAVPASVLQQAPAGGGEGGGQRVTIVAPGTELGRFAMTVRVDQSARTLPT
jgi:hypothetical protein